MPEYQTGKTFSFAEIVHGHESSVRVTDDGLLYAVDLVMVVTGKDRDHAGQALRSISNDIFHSLNFSERQLSTRGGPKTKLVSLQHAIELVMVLPGKVAKETRVQFAEIIKRYIAGDQTLIVEINDNANSTSSIAQLAQVSMDRGVSLDAPSESCTGIKRRHEEVDGTVSMEFVEDAFKIQKEVLGLRNGSEIAAWKNENKELADYITENKLLEKENQDIMKIISDLQEELENHKKEQKNVQEELDEAVKSFIIMARPCVDQAIRDGLI